MRWSIVTILGAAATLAAPIPSPLISGAAYRVTESASVVSILCATLGICAFVLALGYSLGRLRRRPRPLPPDPGLRPVRLEEHPFRN
jgi:hypothetical protein